MICSTQMSAFDVPRGLRVKLHVPLGYWVKLRNRWSQSAKYTHTHFMWRLYCHRKQHAIRDFVFCFKQTLFPYSAHRKVVQRNVARMFFGTSSISVSHCMKYVSRTPWGRVYLSFRIPWTGLNDAVPFAVLGFHPVGNMKWRRGMKQFCSEWPWYRLDTVT